MEDRALNVGFFGTFKAGDVYRSVKNQKVFQLLVHEFQKDR